MYIKPSAVFWDWFCILCTEEPVKLASLIADILEQQEITRQQAAQILGLEIEKVNNLTNGILKEFTIENLLSYLIKLGQNVEIMVTSQQQDKSQPKINVVYQKIA